MTAAFYRTSRGRGLDPTTHFPEMPSRYYAADTQHRCGPETAQLVGDGAEAAAGEVQAVSMLQISVADGAAGPVMALAGEADLTNAAALGETLGAQVSGGARHLIVDLSGLRFADSASVRPLVLAGRAA